MIWKRLKQLWELSSHEISSDITYIKTDEGTIFPIPRKKLEQLRQATFIPRVKENPVDKIVKEQPE